MSYVAPDVEVWSAEANANKTAHNLLREHVPDNPRFPNRPGGLHELGLFEARPSTDVGNDAVDYHTRNRLLAKVANHTTVRSNVFVVWLTVGFFEAHHAPGNPNVVQIGGEMVGMPRHRAFFVVDRTRLEEAVEVDNNGVMTLNWRTFLLHRRELPGR